MNSKSDSGCHHHHHHHHHHLEAQQRLRAQVVARVLHTIQKIKSDSVSGIQGSAQD
jgi:hypothetical protein